VKIKIIEQTPAELSEYEKVPIAFRVETHFRVDDDSELVEEKVEPFIKDYDAHERPSEWSKRFDISRWGIFAAFDEEKRVGGAAVAWKTPELEERDDLACLWDLRVHPDYRGKGVGHELFSRAVEWARARNCRQLKVETQNINVPAFKFYERQGCKLKEMNKNAYDEALNEIQFIWYLDL
jgi:GNAT superfamily N-acetyltransferase